MILLLDSQGSDNILGVVCLLKSLLGVFGRL